MLVFQTAGAQPEIFQGRGGFVKFDDFIVIIYDFIDNWQHFLLPCCSDDSKIKKNKKNENWKIKNIEEKHRIKTMKKL